MVIWWSMYIVLVHMRGADEYLDLEGARIERCDTLPAVDSRGAWCMKREESSQIFNVESGLLLCCDPLCDRLQ